MPTGSVAALNIKFTADIKGVNKAIREAEKSLKSATQTFSSIGNQLSLALSAPIAAFVATSVKAAGELESLKLAMRTTFQGAGRSISEADAELEKLRIAALAPGLDFEQAVKGSLRLQGVGYSAEKARGILVELANALASVGGTADNLDGVTRQFSQMVGKGKVMQDDLRVILENMPNLAKIIKDEFGVTTAEALRDLGVNADEFVTRLTKRMETLPRVSGGIANSIVNAGNAVKMAFANIGESLNKTFNISGKLDQFAEWVSSLAQRFSQLDEGTKRAIAAAATFAFALGPLLKAMQPIVWIAGQLNIGFLTLQKALLQAQSGALTGFIAKWKALDFAMKASVIGATVAVVLALGAAFMVLQKDTSAAAQSQEAYNAANKTAEESVAGQITRVKLLTGVFSDLTKSTDERRAALVELQKIAPDYYKGLDVEKSKVGQVQAATDMLIMSLIRQAKVKEALRQIEENAAKRVHSTENAQALSFWQSLEANVTGFLYPGAKAVSTLGSVTKNLDEQTTALNASDEAMKRIIEENGGMVNAVKTTTATVTDNKDGVDELTKSYRELDKATKLATRQKDTKDLGAFKSTVSPTIAPGGGMPSNIESSLPVDRFKELSESISVASSEMTNYMSISEQMGAINTAIQAGIGGTGEMFVKLGEDMMQHGQIIEGIGTTLVGTMEAIAASGGGFDEMAAGVVKALQQVIGGLIKTGVAAVVEKALLASALNPFAALALGTVAGALAQALFNGIINSVKPPAMAEGGVVSGPTMALVGEYPNARVNPEIVAPEKKLRDIFRGEMGGRGGGTLTARISGRDLLFVLEQAGYDAKRTRGY